MTQLFGLRLLAEPTAFLLQRRIALEDESIQNQLLINGDGLD